LPDYKKLPQAALDRAKLMFLNYPNNPTGAVANRTFFEDTVRFAEQQQIVVAHDFAYGAIGFDGKQPISFLSTPGAKEVGVEFYTMSKTYNMAGWRLGFCVGNRDVVALINLIQDHYYVSVFSAIQRAGIVALTSSQNCVSELVHTYEARRNVFVQGLQRLGFDCIVPGGSFFTWLPVPNGYTSMEFAELALQHAHVVLAPGAGFGEHGEGYVRVGLLANESRLQEAVDRLGKLTI
jgi:L-glutamine---4-(methylsulfanyl)-2-oxobutanoate aminotransferase